MNGNIEGTKLPLLGNFILYKRRWLVLAVFSLVSMTNEIIWISLSSINNIVKVYYGVDSTAINWLSMIYLLLFVFVVASSYMLDRFGLRFTIIMGAVLNCFGSCLRCIGANRDGYVFVFLGSAFAAVGQSFLLFIPPRLAAVWFGEHERATASSVGVLLTMSGVAVGFLMGIIVPNSKDMDNAVQKGMATLLIAQAAISSFLVLISVIFVQDAPPTPPSQSQALILQLQQKGEMQDILEGKKTLLYSDTIRKLQNPAAEETEQTHPEKDNKHREPVSEPVLNFAESLLVLVKNKSFHLLVQAYSIYCGVLFAYNTVLNQMIILKYPGKEKEIGYLGCVANVLGVLAMLFSGIWLDKTRRYKSVSILIISFSALTMLIFTMLLTYNDNFIYMFVSFCIFGLFSYPYMSAGLEHAAETVYPIPEGTSSGILLLFSSLYGIIFIYILGAALDRGAYDIAGYIMVSLYGIALVLVSVHNAPLKRSEADKQRT